MIKDEGNLRRGDRNSYHDRVFEEEINDLINITQSHYEATSYKDALKFGFYELQTARDWYREVTADIGMHVELVRFWISTSALLATPIAPHFTEHIWSSPDILNSPTSIQLASWPTPARPVDRTVIETGAYMRDTIKTIRDAEVSLVKKIGKSKDKGKGGGVAFDSKKPKSVRIYVSTAFPEWQDKCVQAIKDSYSKETQTVDDAKIREELTKQGLIKDKRAMPFVQGFKKRIAQFGATTAFRRALPFSEVAVLAEFIPYLKKSLNLVDVEIVTVEQARAKEGEYSSNFIESSEPGSPAFEYRNV
jgi:leucyl-tRNA synthetase